MTLGPNETFDYAITDLNGVANRKLVITDNDQATEETTYLYSVTIPWNGELFSNDPKIINKITISKPPMSAEEGA